MIHVQVQGIPCNLEYAATIASSQKFAAGALFLLPHSDALCHIHTGKHCRHITPALEGSVLQRALCQYAGGTCKSPGASSLLTDNAL